MMYGDFTGRFLQLVAISIMALAGMLCIGYFAAANEYNILDYNRYDLTACDSPTFAVKPVTPAPAMETRVTAEVADRWFPAPASDVQYTKLLAGAGASARVVTRSRTVTRGYASAGSGYGYARAQPVRRVFGGLFRGRLGCASRACSY